MLVLTRKDGESVLIRVPGRETPIRVMLVKTNRHRCRLGFEADQDILFTREELIRKESNDAESHLNVRPSQDAPGPGEDRG